MPKDITNGLYPAGTWVYWEYDSDLTRFGVVWKHTKTQILVDEVKTRREQVSETEYRLTPVWDAFIVTSGFGRTTHRARYNQKHQDWFVGPNGDNARLKAYQGEPGVDRIRIGPGYAAEVYYTTVMDE